jgi:hypothetical protein
VNATLPLPFPERAPLRVIHGAVVVAVHAQLLADALIAIEPEPPASAKFCVAGEIENEHDGGGAAVWEIVNVFPAALMIALRAAPLFAATRYSILPLPLPDVPETIVSQLAFPLAVHAQPDAVVT